MLSPWYASCILRVHVSQSELSQDVFGYNNDQYNDNRFNIVSIIRAETGVSVQSAINSAFGLIDTSFRSFLSAESTLFLAEPNRIPVPPAWSWNPLRRKEPPKATVAPPQVSADSELYLRGLKDCIVGTINWSYETELYFGSKGDEVRRFGWVFLKLKDGATTPENSVGVNE